MTTWPPVGSVRRGGQRASGGLPLPHKPITKKVAPFAPWYETPGKASTRPEPGGVLHLHRDFMDAGAQILLTDTFGGTSLRLMHAGLEARVLETNQRAVALAREAAGSAEVLVAGSMGPTGQLLEPLGEMTPATASRVYAEQARALADAGADLLVIETQFDLGEATNAIKGARATTTLPIVCSFSYDMAHKTMMGLGPAQVAAELTALGVDIIGANCGRSLPENLDNLKPLRAATDLP